MQKLRRLLLAVAIVSGIALPAALPVAGYAQSTNDALCSGAKLELNGTCDDDDSAARINNILRTVINTFSLIVGVVAVFMVIYGGFRYITSGGDSGNVSGAKNTILYALIGLVIVALAQVIVQFVLKKTIESGV